jgi:7-keto-8-aminopelargonate synthetase-like enzyme
LPTLRQLGVPCESVQHNRIDRVESRAAELARTHRRVFYLCDGVYSMHGDIAPVDDLFALLERQPKLWAYVDDAHGVGWAGRHGTGVVVGRRGVHERMVVALSLAKGFASSGAALVFGDREMARLVFTCGSTLIFSGPLQPPLLGAAIASAKIHLSDELPVLQKKAADRIELFDALLAERGLGPRSIEPSPIRFVQVGHENRALEVAALLRAAGYYVNVSAFPAVPRRRAGIRIVLTCHHTLDDVRGLVDELARVLPRKERDADLAPAERVMTER